jgi:murein DD-endopeptidase MepM/ murein hydrolase activator NlpD
MIKSINKAKIFCMTNIARAIPLILVLLVAVALAVVFASRKAVPPAIKACDEKVLVQSGDTLSTLLAAQDLTRVDANEIDKLLRNSANVRGLRADSDQIIFSKPSPESGVEKITLICGPWRKVILSKTDGVWSAETIDVEKEIQAVVKSGEIRDGDSFYTAGIRAGIPAGIIIDVYDLLSFEIDFERDVRAGQKFTVFYEENYASGEYVNNGSVWHVSFDSMRGNVRMYRFKKPGGAIGYYDEKGNGAIKSLKRTPINNARVSSSFSMNRKHPVLGYTRAHRGVDFRAAAGTPIPSAGAGTVVKRGFDRGGGNYIRIRHNGSFETQYMHMSKFQSGVNVGTKVRQGQIIGYVGSTGLSTGPHLHYEIIQNGSHVNPMTLKLPTIDNLPAAIKEKFMAHRDKVDSAISLLETNPMLFLQL